MTSDPRITHIEHADPGDEQAERREFEAWLLVSDLLPAPLDIALDRCVLEGRQRKNFEHIVRCRVTIEEG